MSRHDDDDRDDDFDHIDEMDSIPHEPPFAMPHVPCHFFLRVAFDGIGGRGTVELSRFHWWPGSPAAGQYLEQHDVTVLCPQEFRIDRVSCDLDNPNFDFMVRLAETSLSDYVRTSATALKQPPPAMTRDLFISCVHDLVDAGWNSPEALLWTPVDGAPEEIVMNYISTDDGTDPVHIHDPAELRRRAELN